MDFKERIFQARKAKGYSQEDLAEMVNVSRQAVSKWETGEAMPDMEKFIALCDALDLSMEYLALGKEQESSAPAPKKHFPWLGLILSAVIFFGFGFAVGHFRPEPEKPLETTPSQPTVTQPVIIYDSPIGDVTVDATSRGKLGIAILPATLSEGMKVQILCQNKTTGKTETLTCEFDGNYYRVSLPRSGDFHYYISAILESNGEKEQLPILELSGDSSSCLSRHLWKNG